MKHTLKKIGAILLISTVLNPISLIALAQEEENIDFNEEEAIADQEQAAANRTQDEIYAEEAQAELERILGIKGHTVTSAPPFEDLVGNECLPKDLLENIQYVITIVEEPITLKQLTQDELKSAIRNKEPFISQICYRNTFSAGVLIYETDESGKPTTIAHSESQTITDLANKCSEKAETMAHNQEKLNIANKALGTTMAFSCQRVEVLLSRGGTTLISGYIRHIYTWAASVVGIIAVFIIVYSGLQISIAGGDSQAIENAKNRIVQSLLGIALMFLAGLILYSVNPTFFTKETAEQEAAKLHDQQEEQLNQ
ncbi:hypothetical protein GF354_06105 [Candidatus Peregrinibacteria bacterium]|nr:hypothetical protein [Candidatus Peregrinibacteria bacterium]